MTHFNRMHCVKNVQIRSFFWSVFSRIRTEYGVSLRIQSECGKTRTRKNSVFGHFSRSDGVIHSMHEELGKHKSLRNKIVVKEDDESRPFPNLSLLQMFLLRFNSWKFLKNLFVYKKSNLPNLVLLICPVWPRFDKISKSKKPPLRKQRTWSP